jgi:glucokinase
MWLGKLIQGRYGFAGELGHLPVLAALDRPCVCGGRGCLEQFASGRGLAERAVAAATAGNANDLIQHARVPASELTSIHVVEAAKAGVPTGLQLVDDASQALAQAVIAISVVTEPDKIYLSGSLGHGAGTLFLPRVRTALAERWPFANTWPAPDVDLDAVGRHAAAVGAALLSRETDSR